jgi:YebC/PmpR family DNA-binding regulatory protein
MSGHSKWATIHRAKAINDGKKGAAFTKLAQNITLAAKLGRGLELAIDRAKQANMPKDNIQRAIDRGLGGTEADNLTEALYEGFGPGGVGILIQAVTDNKLRTAQQIRDLVSKGGGSMANSGSVSYLFAHKGELLVKLQSGKDVETQELEIIDLGVDDVETTEEGFIIYCDKDKTFQIKEDLEKLGYTVESAELTMKPATLIEISDGETKQKLETILEKLEDLDDIQKVWSNYA